MAETYELNDGEGNTPITTVTTSATDGTSPGFDDYGNATYIKVVTKETSSTDEFTKITENTYQNDTDPTRWHLGRLVCARVTSKAPGVSEIRTSGFDYQYNTTGLLSAELVEPEPGEFPECASNEADADKRNVLQVTTTYTHDAFGNRTSVTVTADDDADALTPKVSRTSSTVWGERDSTGAIVATNGRFPITVTNALGHAEEVSFDERFGARIKLVGPNQLATEWALDGFGRVTEETRADGTKTKFTYALCTPATCPEGVQKTTRQALTGALAPNGPLSVEYIDRLGRTTRSETQRFKSAAETEATVVIDTTFDALGRIATKTRPHYDGDLGDLGYPSTMTYDAIGRLTHTLAPLDNGTTNASRVTYDGLTTTTTVSADGIFDAGPSPNLTTEQRVDALGRTLETVDAAGTSTTFAYDANGNLVSTKVNGANGPTVAMDYDLRGRKTAMTDPDMGHWTYTYNGFGELVAQTDAKSQTIEMTYDALGRMIGRDEPKPDGQPGRDLWGWTYDTGTGAAIGKLGRVTLNDTGTATDFTLENEYDGFGRTTQTTRVIGGETFDVSSTYDAVTGRLDVLTYPETGFQVSHGYSATGELTQVQRVGGSATIYWRAVEVTAEGHIQEEELGNGLTTFRDITPETGLVNEIQTGYYTEVGGANAQPSVQHIAVNFDALGNLTGRADFRIAGGIGRGETFVYDSLNRLTGATLHAAPTIDAQGVLGFGTALGTKTFSYDVYGNIKRKSDLSALDYLYGTGNAPGPGDAGPHAVTAAGTKTFAYDDNGSLTAVSEGGVITRTVAWTGFNKAYRIANAAGTTASTFEHDHTRARIQQTRLEGAITTTIKYIGNLYEKRTEGANPAERVHYIRAGGTVAIYTSHENGASPARTRWVHKDHLGSTVNLTNAGGTLVGANDCTGADGCLAYGPWGKRRTASDWSDATGVIVPSQTPRGFTGHEHLDSLGLIHMNGRVYDPEIGRFLSADPFVQAPNNSQSYNRYSYVLNNPLSFTDPSGFFLKKLFRGLKKLLNSPVVRTVLAIGVAAIPGGQWAAAFGLQSGSFGALFTQGFAAGFVGGGGSVKAGIVGGLTFNAFDFIGGVFPGPAENAIAHGVVGGLRDEFLGGDFKAGFLGGALGSVVSPLGGPGFSLQGLIVSTVAGGIGAVLGGGKFRNGAQTAAFGYLINWSTHAHEYFVEAAWGDKLPEEMVQGIKDGSAFQDTAIFQSPEFAHTHGMSSESMNARVSRFLGDKFIRHQMRQMQKALSVNDLYKAGFHLGRAGHTVMDRLSPEHADSKYWQARDFMKHGWWDGNPFSRETSRFAPAYRGVVVNALHELYPGH